MKFLRKQVIEEEFDSDESKVFLNWEGRAFSTGEINRRIKSFFKRYGYDLSVTRLREIVATHVEETSKDLTNEGLTRFLSHQTSDSFHQIEYTALVETSQTHNRSVHHQYYVKKRKAVDDAVRIPPAFAKITPNNPLKVINTDKYEDLQSFAEQTLLIDEQAVDPVAVRDERRYGLARSDYGMKAKRFPWIKEEIEYFHYYFAHIEPYIDDEQRLAKYSTCLGYIKRADDEVVKYFHPHHLENSDRIKTGYLKALASYGQRQPPIGLCETDTYQYLSGKALLNK